jgi:hypothetical protein
VVDKVPDLTFKRLILASAQQQLAAIDAGDPDTAEAFASATTDLIDWHLHGATHWRAAGAATADVQDRHRRDFAAWGGTA